MIEYEFKFIKQGSEHSVDYWFKQDPTFEQIETAINSFEPDVILDYIRK